MTANLFYLNTLRIAGAAFEYDTNKVTMINIDLKAKEFPVKHKTEVAKDIINEIAGIIIQMQLLSSQVTDASF